MSRSHRRRSVVIAVLVVLGVFTIASQHQSAHAAALTVDFRCEVNYVVDPQYSHFTCDVNVLGGTGAYNFAVNTTNASFHSYDVYNGNGTIVGKCGRSGYSSITLRVSDGVTTVNKTPTFWCY